LTNAVLDYFLQFLPILAGICFMLVIKNVAIAKDRIVIGVSEAPAAIKTDKNRAEAMEQRKLRGSAPTSESVRDSFFEREAHDELLVNGFMPESGPAESLRRQALAKLGMADMDWFVKHEVKSLSRSCPELTLFVLDRKELLRHLLRFGGDSGLLLQYLAGYRLSVRAIAWA
jgi:hypothetical protein